MFARKFILMKLTLTLFLLFSAKAQAEGEGSLEERIKKLEETQAELYHTLEEKKEPGLLSKITDKISFGGLIEVDAALDENDKLGDTSSITLATVELAIDAQINEKIKTHVLFLWEEGSTDPIALDEGTIELSFTPGFAVRAGKMYLPFGGFKTHFISDPQTLALGETNKTAALLKYSTGMIEAEGGVFNGRVDKAGRPDKIDDYVLGVRFAPAEPVVIGAFYISDLAENDADITGLTTISKKVGGYGAYLLFALDKVKFDAEYIAAAKRFDAVDLDADSDGTGDRPMAWNMEAAYDINERLEVAAKYEGNKDMPDLPKYQYGVAASYGLYENVAVGIEYLHGKYSDGAGERDAVTAQLAVEF